MTEIGWPTPFGYTVFCDDIRHEVAGKFTHVGMYSGEMKVFASPPAAIPQLCLAVHYFEDPAESNKPLKLLIHLPTDTDESSPAHQIDIQPRNTAAVKSLLDPDEDMRLGTRFEMRLTPFVVTKSGHLRVRIQRGEDTVKLGTLRVVLGTPEEAAQIGVQLPPQPALPPVIPEGPVEEEDPPSFGN